MQLCLEQNRHTVYELIDSHGDVEDLVFVAILLQGELTRHLFSGLLLLLIDCRGLLVLHGLVSFFFLLSCCCTDIP